MYAAKSEDDSEKDIDYDSYLFSDAEQENKNKKNVDIDAQINGSSFFYKQNSAGEKIANKNKDKKH